MLTSGTACRSVFLTRPALLIGQPLHARRPKERFLTTRMGGEESISGVDLPITSDRLDLRRL